MKLSLLVVFVFASIFASAQDVLHYDGPFKNAENEAGEATYSFYVNAENGKQVKHGPFRYKVKLKKDDMRVYRNISGEYKSGWKDGTWEYVYTTKDKKEADGYYYSYNISMTANYDEGWPNGVWDYSSSIKRRRSNIIKGKKTWLPWEEVEVSTMRVHYKHGLLIDSIWKKCKHDSYSGYADDRGFMEGLFKVETDTTSIEIMYEDGFAVSNSNDKSDLDIQKYAHQYYLKYKDDLNAHGAQVDSSSLTFYARSFRERMHNDQYFNYRFIDGDRMITFVGPRKEMKVRYMGLYTRVLNSYMREQDKLKIQGIYAYQIAISRKVKACEKLYKNSDNDINIRKKLEQLKSLESKSKSYICLIKVYKDKVTPYGIAKASKSCNTDITFSETDTRDQILDKILNKAKALSEKANAIECK